MTKDANQSACQGTEGNGICSLPVLLKKWIKLIYVLLKDCDDINIVEQSHIIKTNVKRQLI